MNENERKPLWLELAPMAGYTDGPFRRICGELGCDVTVSEMISAAALHYKDKKTASLAKIIPGEGPVILQLFGHDPAMIAEGAEMLLSGAFPGQEYAAMPAGIDINMGCPVKKITAAGDGSALMRNIPLACQITEKAAAVCRKYGRPLSVKIRIGWDAVSVNGPEMAVALAQSGASKITMHCRTKEELYTPGIHPDVLAHTAAQLQHYAPHTVLVGNGDIVTPADAQAMLNQGCHGLMIGRGALGNPWIFRQIRQFFSGEAPLSPTPSMRRDMAIRLVREVVAAKGEVSGIRESRGRAACFLHGLPGSASLRDRLNHAETEAAFVQILEEIRD